MLDNSMRDKLRSLFSELTAPISFRVFASAHSKQAELIDFLEEIAALGTHLAVERTDEVSEIAGFALARNGEPLGIRFFGIPGGHEFTSLVLAILNADGQGKLPDAGIAKRMQALLRPIRLRTFVSLSCTNCPEVVQALNQLALLSDNVTHDFIDGEVWTEEVDRLGIQGVPSVFEGDALLHSGKAGLGELLAVLERRAGTAGVREQTVSELYDILVLGGGPAGAAAAVYSARKGLKTALTAERIGGQVNDTAGIENLISIPTTDGASLSAALSSHIDAYPIERFEDRRVESVESDEEQRVVLQGGEVLRAKRLIVATGAKWRELGIPGEREYLGRGVAFCPHCDGPFFKGRRVAVVGGGNSGIEAAIDLAGICSHVTVLEFADTLKADRVLTDKLSSLSNTLVLLGVRTEAILGDGKKVTGIRFEHRASGAIETIELDGVFVQIGLVPSSALLDGIVERNRFGEIVTDAAGRTSNPHIYAAGDVTTAPYKQIVVAMGQGASAALAAFEDRMKSD